MPSAGTPIRRYVALGDSSTEGLDDPKAAGGYRGWSERLAQHIAVSQGDDLEYANLAIRGRSTREVRGEQLAAALALKPDFATLFVGTNDVTAPRFDEAQFAADFEAMQRALREADASVLSFTLPDLTPVMPLARFVRGRVLRMNDRIRESSARTGSLIVDFAAAPVTSDPRLWSDDRIHANSEGHARMAAALAQAIGLPGHDDWDAALAVLPQRSIGARAGAEIGWWARHFAPWIGRSLTGQTSGDGLEPKYPEPVDVSALE
ncbi:MAG: lysophospholipase L1-like esterase [Planctomycetota bacterium]